MAFRNGTIITELILLGLSQNLQICIFLFVVFFKIYILTILGNLFFIFAVTISPKLHTPMYYFLCNLSTLDLCYSSNAVPRFLIDLLSNKRSISVVMCMTQMSVGLILGGIECMLLAVMAYDRYIAICFPLHYTAIMSWRVCRNITVIMWLGNITVSTFPTILRPLVFCRENQLNHFYCEILLLLELACGDLTLYKITIVVVGSFTLVSGPIFIIGSYIFIIISVLKIRSSQGRSKAFSTCTSHLTVVLLYFGTLTTMYVGQSKSFSPYLKNISIIYIVITPMLNPLIYSLRNDEVIKVFRRILTRHSNSKNEPLRLVGRSIRFV